MKKGDLILTIFTVGLAVLLGALFLFSEKESGGVVRVTVDGETVLTVPLSEDGEYVITSKSGTNTLSVKDGAARISDADCKGKDCISFGEISKTGEQIICLPNRVIISVTAEKDGLDAITGGVADGN